MRTSWTRALLLGLLCLTGALPVRAEFPTPATPYRVRQALVPPAQGEIVVDGKGDDAAWQATTWSPPFVDIRGFDFEPAPRHETRIKMLWDDDHFYVLAWLVEPDLWATYDRHDMVIYHEHDFEVFLDPDGDNHNYLELEINALGTTWDLLLTKPYRDRGLAVDAWEIPGLQSAVHLDGTLNDPSDTDVGWGVELAIPWEVISEVDGAKDHANALRANDLHLNFSRVAWQLERQQGHYVKRLDPATGNPLAEDNWVWSPQGLVAMHYPERWGRAVLLDQPPPPGQDLWSEVSDELRECAMLGYYAQKAYAAEHHGSYAGVVEDLDLPRRAPYPGVAWPPELIVMPDGMQMIVRDAQGRSGLAVREDGRLTPVADPSRR